MILHYIALLHNIACWECETFPINKNESVDLSLCFAQNATFWQVLKQVTLFGHGVTSEKLIWMQKHIDMSSEYKPRRETIFENLTLSDAFVHRKFEYLRDRICTKDNSCTPFCLFLFQFCSHFVSTLFMGNLSL